MRDSKDTIQDSLQWLSGSIDSSEPTASIKNRESKNCYSIPTRKYSKATGEVVDIHTYFTEIEDEAQRGKLLQAIRKADSMTIGELSRMAGYARVEINLKEAEGKELTEPERTIRDIDLTTLAIFIMNGAKKMLNNGEQKSPRS